MSANAQQRATMPQSPVAPVPAVIIGLFSERTTETANSSASEAKGKALAEMILRNEAEKMQKGKRFLRSIAELDNPGRKAMRVSFREYLQAFRDEAKQWADTAQAEIFASRNRTLGSRVSEYSRFSQACDTGWSSIDWELDYAEVLAVARAVLNGTADMQPEGVTPVGPTRRRRGRVAKSRVEKFTDFLVNMGPTIEDLQAFAGIIRASIKATKDEAAINATMDATIDKVVSNIETMMPRHHAESGATLSA